MKYVFLLGRALFSLIFLIKPLEHFSEKMMNHAANMGAPMPSIFVPLAGILAFVGGVSILLGYKARIGAWLLVIFLVPTTLIMHPVWQDGSVFTSMMQQYCFLKNIALIGTALMIAYLGSGPMSLDNK